jgi:hypothetical protein
MYKIMYTGSTASATATTLASALDAVSKKYGGQRVDYDDRYSNCGSVCEYHVRLDSDGDRAEPVAIITFG